MNNFFLKASVPIEKVMVYFLKQNTYLKHRETVPLKGLSHEIFRPVFWPVWIYLGLNLLGDS